MTLEGLLFKLSLNEHDGSSVPISHAAVLSRGLAGSAGEAIAQIPTTETRLALSC